MEFAVRFDKDKHSFITETESGLKLEIDSAFTEASQCIGIRPMQLLLVGLAACMGANIVAILKKMRQDFSSYEVKVSAERASDPPKVFTSVKMDHFVSGANISSNSVQRAVKLSEDKYCSAYAMFKKTAVMTSDVHITKIER